MSFYYQKVRMSSRSNGSSLGFALIVREEDGTFYLVTRQRGVGASSEATHLRERGITFSSETGYRVSTLLHRPHASFTTLLEHLRTGDQQTLYSPIGETVMMNDVFAADLDQIFMEETASAAQVSGIAIKSGYTEEHIYSGFGGYHSNHSVGFNTPRQEDKPWRIGVELELYARNAAAKSTITRARSNWFMCESDSSVNEAVNGVHGLGIEMKTIPLKACDATDVNFWDEPMTRLKELALSKGFTSTGLHVHISKEIFGTTEPERQKNLRKLQYFYTVLVENDTDAHRKNVTICGRERGYHAENPESYLSSLSKFVKTAGIKLADMNVEGFTQLADDQHIHLANNRWDLNVNNWNSYRTIEFRKGKGAISKLRLAAICAWWEQMCLYCSRTPYQQLSFSDFFAGICASHPAVAHFFTVDEEV